MEYTVLYRMRGGEISRATVVTDNLGALATHLTCTTKPHAVPMAWCEGSPAPEIVGYPHDGDKRQETMSEWIKAGRAIASFNDCGTIRYVPQTPRAPEEERGITIGGVRALEPRLTVKRVKRAVKSDAAPTTGPDLHATFAQIRARAMHLAASNPVITVNKEDDEKMVTGVPAWEVTRLEHLTQTSFQDACDGMTQAIAYLMTSARKEPDYIPSKVPTFAGLMVCSSDTRANDHQVQARFGSAS